MATDAGVVVPVFRDDAGIQRIALIQRACGGVHGGEIGLPGGKVEDGDADPAATAVREIGEELGMAREAIEIIETLPVVATLTTGYRIHPFLARVQRPRAWHPQPDEVAAVLEPAVAELADPAARARAYVFPAGSATPIDVACLRLEGMTIWGATYRILAPLVERLGDHPLL